MYFVFVTIKLLSWLRDRSRYTTSIVSHNIGIQTVSRIYKSNEDHYSSLQVQEYLSLLNIQIFKKFWNIRKTFFSVQKIRNNDFVSSRCRVMACNMIVSLQESVAWDTGKTRAASKVNPFSSRKQNTRGMHGCKLEQVNLTWNLRKSWRHGVGWGSYTTLYIKWKINTYYTMSNIA